MGLERHMPSLHLVRLNTAIQLHLRSGGGKGGRELGWGEGYTSDLSRVGMIQSQELQGSNFFKGGGSG